MRLGLIGGNIAASQAPRLHRLAGAQVGLDVRYDLLVPKAMGLEMSEVLAGCARDGYRGVNITYPYKERVMELIQVDDPTASAMGAVNTVVFGPNCPRGYNTDHSGFKAAYRAARGSAPPGVVLMIGAGGVGRAVAFALAELGLIDLRLADRERRQAMGLARDLNQAFPYLRVKVAQSPKALAKGASGIVNCTPLGMAGIGGSPLMPEAMVGADWAFDAVYTPADTQFLQDAGAVGVQTISGWELFFHQGVHAWTHFSGTPPDAARLSADLLAG